MLKQVMVLSTALSMLWQQAIGCMMSLLVQEVIDIYWGWLVNSDVNKTKKFMWLENKNNDIISI